MFLHERAVQFPSLATAARRVVLIGHGMVGHRLCEALVRQAAGGQRPAVVVFGEEPRPAYDRVHLAELLQGRPRESLVMAREDWYRAHGMVLRLGDPIVGIDRDLRIVRARSGACVRYDRLVLATGAAPIAPLEGVAREQYHLLRTLDDVAPLVTDLSRSGRVAVVGGGLLGLETAGILAEMGLEVTIIEAGPCLLGRQIDEETAGRLRARLEGRGIRVLTEATVRAVSADVGRKRVSLSTGDDLIVDLIIAAAGVKPRDELAAQAGLARHRRGGFVVNDLLQTSDPLIHAIGDCAVHRDVPCGTVEPGYEMAETLAATLLDRPRAFRPPARSIRLKLPGLPLMVAGEASVAGAATVVLGDARRHRVVALEGRRPVGAVALGEWRDWNVVEAAIRLGQRLGRLELRRLRRTGELGRRAQACPATEETVVCACNLVTLGALRSAIAAGNADVERLSATTRAATACGSCRPALDRLVGGGTLATTARARGLTAVAALTAVVVAAVLTMRSAIEAWRPGLLARWDFVLRDPGTQMRTGFALVGLVLPTVALALRQRIGRRWPGAPELWRLVHATLGLSLVAATVVHTGLRLGQRVNLALSLALLLLALSGAVGAGRRSASGPWSARWRWLHLLLLWPALGLLAAHVVAAYYY